MGATEGSWLQRMAVFLNRDEVTIETLVRKWKQTLDCSEMLTLPVGLKVVVLVGAGISVKSGIPDFRSPGTGLYSNLSAYQLTRPEDMFTLTFFEQNPHPFYEFAKSIWPTGQHRPTRTHTFLKLLEDKGILHRVYTQNIDGLERLAGVSPDKVVEAHGSFSSASCITNNHPQDPYFVKERIFSNKVPIHCTECGSLVKPDITFFGQMLPDRFYELVTSDLAECDLLIILGTSLKVAPFNSLPSKVNVTVPRLLINREFVKGTGPRPLVIDGPGAYRDIFIAGDCDEEISRLIHMLGWEENSHQSMPKIDMHKRSRPKAPPMVSETSYLDELVSQNLPAVQRPRAETLELEEERSIARMEMHAAILQSDIETLKQAVGRATQAGLSYWELAAATDVLLSFERRMYFLSHV